MRVLFLIDSLHGGGAETSVVEMLPAMRDRGIETSLVTILDDDNALTARVDAAGVNVRRLCSKTLPGRVLEFRRELKRQSPDVLHTSLTWSDLIGRLAAIGIAVPVVTTLVNSSYGAEHRRNSRFGAWSVRIIQALDFLVSRRTTVFHAISEDVGVTMTRRLRLRPERVVVVHRGRDDHRLGRRSQRRRVAARNAVGVPEFAPLAIVVGRLDKQKAVDVALAAVERTQSSAPELEVLVVGRDGNDAPHVRQMATKVNNVQFLGHRTDVAELMCAADCLVFPSRWEGLGGTLVEALALELPVVATDIGPIREVMGDVAWPLVPIDDSARLSDELSRVISADLPVAEISVRGRARFEQSFTTEHAADGMVELYLRAIGGVDR
jgi:glycosyltransferase involved in cell wall biosynthesis